MRVQLWPISDDKQGNASLDIRLGRWFLTLHSTKLNELNFNEGAQEEEQRYAQKRFVRFDGQFYLHPGRLLLGAMLEWIWMPNQCCGAIVGKSSFGRHGSHHRDPRRSSIPASPDVSLWNWPTSARFRSRFGLASPIGYPATPP
ncbi:dCTP deaminase domain-containing protein [Bradyrhizobium oligotrophicum]|uniref:dCTP deaminase domain-containing protein n=1 Tax=Bradyrhizobium oligotrophicum TaxID=44255 RepID=UPI003EBA6A8F